MNNYFSTPAQTGSIYDELAKLKAQMPSSQLPNYRTTFTDIATEWNNCSSEEQNFINSDEEYLQATLEYQQGFNSFLVEMMGAQFLSSSHGKTAENVLITLRKAKEKFHKQTNDDIKNIQEQNNQLKNEVEELKKMLGERYANRQRDLV